MAVGQTRATLDDLYRMEGKAELINGRIVELMATGDQPNQVAGNIYVSLRDHSRAHPGTAYTDNVGYAVPELPSGRESFSPDASYYVGRHPANRMRFIPGPPTLAVEVRSENDYGPAAEEAMADKRADYFAAGTLVVWDVDPLAECVHVYRSAVPTNPVTYRRSEMAEAEPAIPGWTIAVDDVFWLST
jgi:Uma2 family endonuclease